MDDLRLWVFYTIFSMILINALLALILLFSPKPESKSDRHALRYFVAYFAGTATAFAIFGLRFSSPQWVVVSIFFTSIFILFSFYCLHAGLCHRSRRRSILMSPAVALPAFALFILVHLYLFFSESSAPKLTSYLTFMYVEVLLLFSLRAVHRRQVEFYQGDNLTRLSLYAAIGLILVVVGARALLEAGDIRYLLVVITSNTAVSILLLGGMYGSFLHDAVISHYRNSVTDSMTGLYNRRYLIGEARQLVSLGERHHFPISVVMCDIDKFKNINDTYGHDFGDEVIKAFARVLRSCVREEDILARWGGEEFVALLAKTNVDQAQVLVERMRKNTSRTNLATASEFLGFTASFGVALVSDGSDVEGAIKQADEALYQAKEGGRNRVEFYTN